MTQKSAAAFGSYGWSGEAVKLITKDLENCGFTIIDQGHKALWMPDDEERFYCEEYGKSFIEKL
jgi:anaerobic nitric oxide reductase flavorubredoxin